MLFKMSPLFIYPSDYQSVNIFPNSFSICIMKMYDITVIVQVYIRNQLPLSSLLGFCNLYIKSLTLSEKQRSNSMGFSQWLTNRDNLKHLNIVWFPGLGIRVKFWLLPLKVPPIFVASQFRPWTWSCIFLQLPY